VIVEADDPAGDWTAPGVYEAAPGVFRIPLPLPSDGLRAVNVYALRHDSELALVDSGWALELARHQLDDALAALGAGLGDVRRFLVTHIHRDHYTLATALRREFGGRIALGRGEQPAVEFIQAPGSAPLSAQLTLLNRAGAEELVARIRSLRPPDGERELYEPPDRWLADSERLDVGGRTLRVQATPGHTRGHVVYRDEAAAMLFAGDHVLPHITPSIGFEPVPGERPLADFLASLRLLRAQPDARLLPAHGPAGGGVHARLDELLAHHDHRLAAMFAAVRDGRETAAEVAAGVPWTRRERALPDLDPFNQMLAVLETVFHLDLLVEQGRLVARSRDAVARYAVAAQDVRPRRVG
jgi:glyoxylase-like metal-dependent hydrolase (beta-lactamase superfamily II)